MHVLVTGGAGYVGSILSAELIKKGHNVTIIDDMRSGHSNAVPEEAGCYVADFAGTNLEHILQDRQIDTVIHVAASMSPSISLGYPAEYFQNNIVKSINMLNIMLLCNIKNIIFSSSACVYGTPNVLPVTEDCLKVPTTPYGATKLMFEQILEWYRHAYGINYIAFRYQNVAGTCDHLGSAKPENNGLRYNILDVASGKNLYVPISGNTYPTPDGTCIRDYVHIKDIARAYIMALEHMETASGVYNLGSGKGSSVSEVVEYANQVTCKTIQVHIEPQRPGDPPVLIADITKAKKILGWAPQYSDLETIIGDTWNWIQKHPKGYSR